LKRRENEELAVAERYVGLSRNLNLDRMRRSCGNWEEGEGPMLVRGRQRCLSRVQADLRTTRRKRS
jgi:hypothetical protein